MTLDIEKWFSSNILFLGELFFIAKGHKCPFPFNLRPCNQRQSGGVRGLQGDAAHHRRRLLLLQSFPVPIEGPSSQIRTRKGRIIGNKHFQAFFSSFSKYRILIKPYIIKHFIICDLIDFVRIYL